MDTSKFKGFIFNGLLLQEDFQALEKEGISVRAPGDFLPVSHVIEADFSPKFGTMRMIWPLYINLSSA